MKGEIRFQVGRKNATYSRIPGASVYIKEMAQGGQLGAAAQYLELPGTLPGGHHSVDSGGIINGDRPI